MPASHPCTGGSHLQGNLVLVKRQNVRRRSGLRK